MKKQVLSGLLVLCLIFSLLPVSAFADTAKSGTCGENLTWTLDSEGTLTISGTGAMTDYDYINDSNAPWFNSRSSIKRAIIESGVTSIGDYAFYYCYRLTSVTIPDSVTTIGGYAFYDCSYLTSVTIGNSVTSIGDSAFRKCTGLTEINYNAKAVTDLTSSSNVFYEAGMSGSGIKVTFGDGVEKIPAYLFEDCNGLRRVTIGNSVTSIGNYAFYDCNCLTKVTIPDSVTSIGDYAFCFCSGLTSVTIGNSVTSIAVGAFKYCSNLTSVTIGNSVTSIGDTAFYNCTRLTEINYNAKAVRDLTSSFDVFDNAGTDGSGIKVTFGEKVKKVPDYLFSYQHIREIVFLGNAPTIGSVSFNGVRTSAYYPYGNDTWTSEVMLNYGGQITWKPYSDAEAVSVVCNGKTSYVVGDELEKNSISVTIERSDGCVETFNYASGKITLGEYDMSKSGKQSITVTCRGVTAQLNIYIHDLTSETMPANDYPESSHNYEDNLDKTYTYTADGAYSLDVTFSNESEVETNIDYIYVNGTTYTGKELANKTVHINGDTLTVRLVSDDSDGAYGFSIDSIIANYVVYDYTDTVVAPTCTAKGYTIHTCACGDSYVDSYTDALGHSYKNGKCTRCGAADPNYIAAPALSITTSAGHPKIYWNAVDGATKYWVYRSTDGTNFSYYDRTDNTSYTNNSTKIGTLYYYKVKAVKAVDGKDVASVYSTTRSIRCKPAAPTMSIYRTNGKPQLKWSAVTGATKYWIYRSTDGVNFSYYDSTTKTSYTNSGAASGKKYYYRVKAVAVVNGTNVTSANSNTKSLMTTLAKPTVSITTSNGKPKITWKAVTGADKYYVYRSTDGKNFSYYDSTTKLSYTNTGAKKNTKYYYKVKAICSANTNANSAYSAVVSIKATK